MADVQNVTGQKRKSRFVELSNENPPVTNEELLPPTKKLTVETLDVNAAAIRAALISKELSNKVNQ